MRFTLIGHAAVFIETSGPSLLLDPWLWGSCFGRSWWHYPPLPELEPRWLSPDLIYLTLYHFDHFHYRSMRKLDKRIKVMIPRYAVPFASTIAFLHPESSQANASAITPAEIAREFDASGGVPGTDVVVMAPGDTWESGRGFELGDADWFSDREARIERLAETVRPKLENAPVEVPGRRLVYEEFAAYMGRFFRALPPLVPRLLLSRPIVFDLPSSPERFWVIDFVRKRVTRHAELSGDWASVIRVNEALAADAMSKDFLCAIGGTMRLRVRVARGGISQDLAFWALLVFWESGYLPLWRRFVGPRFLRTLWDRRREAIDQLEAIFGGSGSLLNRRSRDFTPTTKHHAP